jgi:hypothetical protein
MNRWRTAGLAALLTVAVTACSSNAGSSPTPTPTPTPSPVPSAAASSGAISSGLFPFPSLGNSDTALEALLPDTIDGITLQKYSMRADQFAGSAQADPQTQAFLSSLGVSLSDISVAFGFGIDASTQQALGLFAFKAPGASSDTLLSVFKTAANTGGTTYNWQSQTVGGKSVQVASEPDQPEVQVYLYATNGVLFLVSGTGQTAADALSALP